MKGVKNAYLISNGSMNIFPDNSRSFFVNRLASPISSNPNSTKSIYLSLDSIVFENSIIQYPSFDSLPDIICFNQKTENKPDLFKLPEIYFENSQKLVNLLKIYCVGKFVKKIELRNEKFVLQTNGKCTFISIRFFDFLRLERKYGVSSLGSDWVDDRFKIYYGKYYVIQSQSFLNLQARKRFDLNVNIPALIKVVSPDVKVYVSGNKFKNELCTFPIDLSKKSSLFTPRNIQYFALNSTFLNNISIQLVDENNIPIQFSTGPPTIIRVRIQEMSSVSECFHVQISNNDTRDTFPDNTASHFKSKLSKNLNLNGDWQLALTRIYIPPGVLNISYPFNYIKVKKIFHIRKDKKNTLEDFRLINIGNIHCPTIEQLIDVLNSTIKKYPFQFKLNDGKISIIRKMMRGYGISQIRLHHKLACILGFKKQN